jgi:ribosomal-protein-alanine N-acetyltransferase
MTLPHQLNLSVFDSFPILETRRLLLREFSNEDLGVIFDLRSSDRVGQFIARQPASTIEEAQEVIDKIHRTYAEKQSVSWATVIKATGILAGGFGLYRFDHDNHRAEIGGEMLPAYWGQRLAIEAVDAVLNYGFEVIGLHSIEARIWPENKSVVNLLKFFGFEEEGRFKEALYFNGAYRDWASYSLLAPKQA